jgi:hypothetical protein
MENKAKEELDNHKSGGKCCIQLKIEETMSLLSDKAKNTIKKEYYNKTRNNMQN